MSNPAPSQNTLAEQLKLSELTLVDRAFFQRLLALIEARFLPLERSQGDLEATTRDLQRAALDRINDALEQPIAEILAVQELGYLTAPSSTPHTLIVDQVLTFVVDEGPRRNLFTPSPFIALTREDNPNDYAVARRVNYDPLNGRLTCQIVGVFGNPGPHEDWIIAGLAGPTTAMINLLNQAFGVLSDAEGARDTALAVQTALGTPDQLAIALAAADGTFDPAIFASSAELDAVIANNAALHDIAQALAGALDQVALDLANTPRAGNAALTEQTATVTLNSPSNWTDVPGMEVSLNVQEDESEVHVQAVIAVGVDGSAFFRIVDATDTPLSEADADGNTTPSLFAVSRDTDSPLNLFSLSGVAKHVPGAAGQQTYKLQARSPGAAIYLNRAPDDTDSAAIARTVSTIQAIEIQPLDPGEGSGGSGSTPGNAIVTAAAALASAVDQAEAARDGAVAALAAAQTISITVLTDEAAFEAAQPGPLELIVLTNG